MQASSRGEWLDDFFAGVTAYYLTSLPVFLGIWFGVDFPRPSSVSPIQPPSFVSVCVRFDANHYVNIVRNGYSYDPEYRSVVAFFPAYPLLSRAVSRITGLSPEEAALVTAHLALVGAFFLLARYVRVRWPEATGEQRAVILAVFGLWPTGLFFRMPYTESLFVCVTLGLLYGMARNWPLWLLALIAGLGTAVRPVGVALTMAFVWHISMLQGNRPFTKIGRILFLAPLACWGLLIYMVYQWSIFGTPLAFAHTQEHWNLRVPQQHDWKTKLGSLAILEPIWNVYVPTSKRYWGNIPYPCAPLFNFYFWNPIQFLLAVMLVSWGGWKRWLTGSELALGTFLLGIPYATRGFEMSMASHGRFAAVAVVNYLVLGRMLSPASSVVVIALCTTLALFIFMFTFLYTKNFLIF